MKGIATRRPGSAATTHTPTIEDVDVLRAELEPSAARWLDRIIEGNNGDGAALLQVVPRKKRGRVAVALYLAGVSPYALRYALRPAWMFDNREVLAAVGTELVPMFRYAAFPAPGSLPDVVTVWRGTRGIRLDQARAGHSWSPRREIACAWIYALSLQHGLRGVPLLVRAEVPRSDILFYDEEGEQKEVVLPGVCDAVQCGTPADWHAAARRYAANRAQEMYGDALVSAAAS